MENNEEAILRAAEIMVREGGYNAFSFRSIADEVGIKSSSVHYYFPTKEDLGAAVARQYTDRFIGALKDPSEYSSTKGQPVRDYVKAFRDALINDKQMCLCGMLGAEITGLPKAVGDETKAFFERNIEWLIQALRQGGEDRRSARKRAVQALSLLEGAMIASNVMGDIKVFDQAADLLLQNN